MQSVKISLPGSFWDSQIYSGELMLFGDSGEYHKINWSAIVDEIADNNPDIQTAIRVAFSDSDLFYTSKVRKILIDPLIAAPIKTQLNSLSQVDLQFEMERVGRNWATSDSPFDFLPIDTDVYYSNLLACGEYGVFSASRGMDSKRSDGYRKHFDGSVLRLKASNESTAVAVAAGSDGLFQIPYVIDSNRSFGEVEMVSNRACSSCDWAFQSIVAWDTTSAFLAHFDKREAKNRRQLERIFDSVIDEEVFFGGSQATSSYVWGSHEKMFEIKGDALSVVNYDPREQRSKNKKEYKKIAPKDRFSTLGTLGGIGFSADQIVASGTAPFGSILELADRIVVLRSDGEIEQFPGEAVQWRLFPRSERYSNQLHIIYDDKIVIVSFTHDYFVNQSTKLTGFSRAKDSYEVHAS